MHVCGLIPHALPEWHVEMHSDCPHVCMPVTTPCTRTISVRASFRTFMYACALIHARAPAVSAGHLAALEKLEHFKGSDVFNLGTGHGISVLEMVDEFRQASGAEVPYEIVGRRSGDVAMCYADPSKAREGLGWQAQLGLKDMCRDLWRWTVRNPNGYADDLIEAFPAPSLHHHHHHGVAPEAHSAAVPTNHKIRVATPKKEDLVAADAQSVPVTMNHNPALQPVPMSHKVHVV
jgi:hypothetical protein